LPNAGLVRHEPGIIHSPRSDASGSTAVRFLPQSIAGRLTIWFLAISLIPCAAAMTAMFLIFRIIGENAIQEEIQLVLKERRSDLEWFVQQRARETQLLANAPSLISAIETLKGTPPTEPEGGAEVSVAGMARLAELAAGFGKALKFDNYILFEPGGRLIYSWKPGPDVVGNLLNGPLSGSALATAFSRSLQLNETVTSHVEQYPGMADQRFLTFQASPIRSGDVLLGVLVIQLDQEEFEANFEDYVGLGESGDVYAGRVTEKGEVAIVCNLRNDDGNKARMRTYPIGGPNAVALQEAAQEKEGHGVRPDYRGVESVAAWTYLPSLGVGLVVDRDRQEAYQVLYRYRWLSIGLLLLTGVLVVPAGYIAARSFSRPIQEASDVASRVAAGDLTKEIRVQGSTGEVGRLLNALRNMNAQLRSLIGHVQHSIVTVMSACSEISATARTQQRTADDLGVAASEVSAAVNQISATSQELLGTMSEVRESAKRTAEITTNGQHSLIGMHNTMTRLADSTGSISSRLSVISERANNINLVVTTITKVADQTNLLSINAAIEAEKAGEYGRGFIVVAREIRRLADQTAVATLDIERIVKEMQHSVAAGVMEMDKFNEQVRQGVGEVGTIGEQLNEVLVSVQEVLPRFEQVTEGMSAQSQGAQQIREAMGQLRDGATQTADSLREFQDTTEQLREAISHLQDDISKFQT
jgi:methyl-accepting chemotaxis protein WspA